MTAGDEGSLAPIHPAPGAEPASDPGIPPGTLLAGKYRVERELGRGGMGRVIAAEHVELGERVAIKLMLREALESPDAEARFLREARAAVKIKGDHVARVHDVGRIEDGVPYIVMEYLEGEDLGALLRREGPLPAERAAEYVLQACEAIAEAHALGIVHRDLKPSNLFLTRRPDGSPFIKVLDFGISKILPREDGSGPRDLVATHTRQLLGSPLYMAPEQLSSSRNVVPASDLWALGAILFELTAGAPPFEASSLGDLRRQILFEDAPALRRLRPEVPRRFEAIVQRCLEKDPARRYEDIAAFAEDLAEIAPARVRPVVARIRGILRNAGLDDGTPLPPVSRTAPRRRSRVIVIGAVVVALGAVAGLLVFVGRAPSPPADAANGIGAASATATASAAASVTATVTVTESVTRTEAAAATASATASAAAAATAPAAAAATASGPGRRRPGVAATPPSAAAPATAPAASSAPFSYSRPPLK